MIVCEPSAQGVYHSGDPDHKGHWVQGNGVRDDANKPKHIPCHQAFFLQQDRSASAGSGRLSCVTENMDRARSAASIQTAIDRL